MNPKDFDRIGVIKRRRRRRRSRPTAKPSDHEVVLFAEGADSKSPKLSIDASPGAISFEIGLLRLSAFQNDVFC